MIDDDPTALEGDARAVLDAGARDVAGGTHASAVLDALGAPERYPDLIVADLRLGNGADGVDAIAQLRDELGRDVPALVVTGDMGDAAASACARRLAAVAEAGDPGRSGGATRLMATSEATLVV